jgi:hypothetical protein
LVTAEHDVASTGQVIARPQLLRARGLLLQRQGEVDAALEALLASAELARSYHAGIQLGRTLDAVVALARQRGDAALASRTETELVQLVDRIGPEVGVMSWAHRGVEATAGPSAGAQSLSQSAVPPVC